MVLGGNRQANAIKKFNHTFTQNQNLHLLSRKHRSSSGGQASKSAVGTQIIKRSEYNGKGRKQLFGVCLQRAGRLQVGGVLVTLDVCKEQSPKRVLFMQINHADEW